MAEKNSGSNYILSLANNSDISSIFNNCVGWAHADEIFR